MRKFLSMCLLIAAVFSYIGLSARESAAKVELLGGSDYPVIYGSLVYANNFVGGEVGLYEIPTSDDMNFKVLFKGPAADGGGVCQDDIYYAMSWSSATGTPVATVTKWDINSGKNMGSFTTDIAVIGHLAVDPTTNDVYGITFRPELGGYMLSKVVFDNNKATVTRIKNLDGFWAAFAIDSKGQFYGIKKIPADNSMNIQSSLYKIDRNTGNTTLVGSTGQHPYDNTGAIIDIATDRMFWVVSNDLEGSKLVEVDLESGYCTDLAIYDQSQQVVGLYIPEPEAKAGAPAACSNVSLAFNNGSKTGTLTVTAPKNLYQSQAAGTGDLYIKVTTNNQEVASAKVNWGEQATVNVDMTSMPDGLYNFSVCASNMVGDGPSTYLDNKYVGVDSPASTEATLTYVNGTLNLEWAPVTVSAHGGWFDKANMTYTVTDANGSTVASGLDATTWTKTITEPDDLTEYCYKVEAVCGDKKSEPAVSNTIILGHCTLPYTSNFASGLKFFTTVDGNGDNTTWQVTTTGDIKCGYNQYEKMNDWLITPPFKFEAGKPYMLTFQAYGEADTATERLEVCMGNTNTAQAMTTTLIEPTELKNTSFNPKSFETVIIPETTGSYFIGFHGISDAYMYGLHLTNFTVKAHPLSDMPAAPTNFKVTADETGALKAAISFNVPDKTLAGDNTTVTKVEILRNQTVVKTIDNPTAGQKVEYTDAVAEDGTYEYSAVAYNANGAGVKATATVFVGVDVPMAPKNVVISRTDTEGMVKLTWDPVTTDVNGMKITGTVKYTVTSTYGGTTKLLTKDLTATSYTYLTNGSDDQMFVECTVVATTAAGTSEKAVSATIPVGEAYTDFEESFPEGAPTLIWGESKTSDTAQWQIYNEESGYESADADNGFLTFYGGDRGDNAMLFSGLISLKNVANPGLQFQVYNNATTNSPNNDRLKVLLRDGNNLEWITIFDKSVEEAIDGKSGWTKVMVSLKEYAGHDVQIAFVGEVVNYFYLFIDAIKVGALPATDMCIGRLSAPASAKTGDKFVVSMNVKNYGATATDNYSVELYQDGVLLQTQKGKQVAPGAQVNIDFNVTMAPDAVDVVRYMGKVVANGDANTADNSSLAIRVQPGFANVPGATGLKVTGTLTGSVLTWTAAKATPAGQAITQDFEDGDSFAAVYGDWIFVDADNSPVSGPKDMNIPNIEYGVTKGSFWIWDNAEVTSEDYEPHGGTKCLFTLFRKDDGKADDWAISPELYGTKQTISFYASSIASIYPEQIEIYYSMGGTEIKDFIKIEEIGGKVPGKWTLYTFEVPEGAKRFAIRSCATGAFSLRIDDVTFIPADPMAGATLLGYDVYRNREKVTAEPVPVCNYTDSGLTEGQNYTYRVVAVYDKAYGKPSNSASFRFEGAGISAAEADALSVTAANGHIVISGAEGLQVSITAINGIILYNGVAGDSLSVAAAPGIYVVNAGGKTCKINVK